MMPDEPLINGSAEHDFEIRAPQRVVLKFGGTSIGKYPLQIAKIILYDLYLL